MMSLPTSLRYKIFLFLCLFLGTTLSAQTTIYVKQNTPAGNDGSSWANAYDDLQDALAAATAGDRIWVAKGTYYPSTTDATISFKIPDGVKIYGGFEGDESTTFDVANRTIQSNETILSGNLGNQEEDSDNSSQIIIATDVGATTIIDGFTISDAINTAWKNTNAHPTIKNCSFKANKNKTGGAGAILNINSNPVFENCSFISNEAKAGSGGAIHNSSSDPKLVNCLFIGNTASADGGAMDNFQSSPEIINCTFSKNVAINKGGAIKNYTGSPQIINTIIWGNSDEVNNPSNIFNAVSSDPTYSHSLVEGIALSTENNNIDGSMDPLFANFAEGDLRLTKCSPVINKGDNTKNSFATDLDGNDRNFLTSIDLGAYEFQSPPSSSTNTIIYVKADANGDNSGSSWDNAFTDLQDALVLFPQCTNHEQIWVAKGTYSDEDVSLVIPDGIELYGGFAGDELAPFDVANRNIQTNETKLSGYTFTATDVGETTIIDGFTITSQNLGYTTITEPDGEGGYVFSEISHANGNTWENKNANLTIKNCSFIGNVGFAGAIVNTYSNPLIVNCYFQANVAYGSGGAIHNSSSHPKLLNCIFVNNIANNYGGAIDNYLSHPEIINCTFNQNRAGNEPTSIPNLEYACDHLGWGGAISNLSSNPKIYNTILWGNTQRYTFFPQRSIVDRSSSSEFKNCILEDRPLFSNCSPLSNAEFPGTRSINPSLSLTFELNANSPAIDAGDPTLFPNVATATDFAGNPRKLGENIDIGAYEYVITFLNATNNQSDAYINLDWQLDKDQCLLADDGTPYQDGVYIQILADGKPVYGEHLIDFASLNDPNNASANGFNYAVAPDELVDIASISGEYTNSFRHQVGPNQSVIYDLIVYEFGPGKELCKIEDVPGSTTIRQTPENFIAVDATNNPTEVRPDSIKMTWKNKSELTSAFLILRDDKVITSINQIDSVNQEFEWTDVYRFDDTASLVNGQDYSYELHTVSDLTGETYPDATDMGNTIGINFKATDGKTGEPKNRVELTWADMSEYAEDLQIFRNELLLTTLAANATHYPDAGPNFGDTTDYQVVLLKDGQRLVADMDTGFAPAVGQIKGKAISELGDYPIPGAIVQALNADSSIFLLDTTDFQGNFCFENIVYNRGSDIIVSVSKDDVVFENNPDTATLSNDQPIKLGIVFRGEITFETLDDPISITDSSSTPDPTMDKLTLAWTYNHTLTDTTFFNLYRENILIAQFNDLNVLNDPVNDFTDLTGKANEEYTYTLKAFRIRNGLLSETSVTLTDIFPEVAKVPTLTANLETTNLVNLTWSHTSENFDGFKLLRNGIEIADLAPDIESYTDAVGEPGTSLTYGIVAYRQIELVTYSSEITESATLDLPALAVPLNPTVEVVVDLVKVRWTVPNHLSADFNYSGFRVSRKEAGAANFELIGTIDKYFVTSNEPYEFLDKTGIPDVEYGYQVSTYVVGGKDLIYENIATATPASINFPDVIAPNTATINANDANFIHDLSWSFLSEPTNYDGFIIYQGTPNDSIVITGNLRTFQTHPKASDYGNALTYSIATYRQTDNNKYLSDKTSFDEIMVPPSSTDLQMPTEVTASTNLPNLIKLGWEYPVFIQATFIIERGTDGVNFSELAKVTPTERAYYDYEVELGIDYTYRIKAAIINEERESERVAIKGYTNRYYQIQGRVYSQNNGLGTADVQLQLMLGSRLLSQTLTDSSGYYVFQNISQATGANLKIVATGFNTNFSTTPTIVPTKEEDLTLIAGKYTYHQDFINGYNPTLFPCDTITPPIHFSAEPNYADLSVALSWSMGSENYDGFEVFRGITDKDKLVDVAKGEPFFAIDSMGAPSFTYLYTIRSYWDTEEGRVYSKKQSIYVLYPVLLPVESLTASEIKGENRVAVRWGHFLNNHDGYIVTRNDETVATISTDSMLTYIDSTGVPGQLYKYTVYAAKVYDGKTYLSEARTVELLYPEVLRVDMLEISNLSTGRHLCSSSSSTILPEAINNNAWVVDWTYNLTKADGFEIYRDGESLAIIRDSTHYHDFTAVPQKTYLYEVAAFVERGGVRYYSRTIGKTAEPFELQAPFNITFDNQSIIGAIEVQFEYLAGQADGFYIYRSTSTDFSEPSIGNILVSDLDQTTFNYIDEGIGIADLGSTKYYYGIQAYVNDKGEAIPSVVGLSLFYDDFFSNTCSPYPGADFLTPIPPTGVKATVGEQDIVNLQWEYPSDAIIDGFTIERYEGNTIFGLLDNDMYEVYPSMFISNMERSVSLNYNDGYRNDSKTNSIFVVRAVRFVANTKYQSSTYVPESSPSEVIDLSGHPAPSNYSYADGPLSFDIYGSSVSTQAKNVQADDGISTTQTKITWDFESDSDFIDVGGFLIYRDNEAIGNVNEHQRNYIDSDGIPGKIYSYTVRAFYRVDGKVLPYRTSYDDGYKKADGKISGTVKTLIGQAPISNATITLKGTIGLAPYERPFDAETTTDNDGAYVFAGVNYGEGVGNFIVTAKFGDHTFRENDIKVTLDSEIKTAQVHFLDEVAYVLQGVVKHADADAVCGIEGVKVTAYIEIDGSEPNPIITTTDKDGKYSLAVNPQQDRLDKIYIVIDSLELLGGDNQAVKDSTRFSFKAQQDTLFANQGAFDNLVSNEITTLDFYQTTTYPVAIQLRNTCNGVIEGEQFRVRIRDESGCFDKIIDLDASGKATVDLPPVDGLTITATDAINNTSIGNIVLDYLKYRSARLNLKSLHKQYLKKEITTKALTESTSIKLTFHVTPSITYTQFGQYICEAIPVKIIQEAKYAVNIGVLENHGGVNCAVEEGYVIINNPAATEAGALDTLRYDVDLNGFPIYTFTAGNPNPVGPYLWGMEMQYFTANGDYLKTETIPIGVEGAVSVPGYDAIVDPDDEGIPYPLFILRDPPGDNSSSSIAAGQSFSTSIAHSRETSTGYQFVNNNGIQILAATNELTFEINGSFEEAETNTMTISGSLSQSISTSGDAIGEEADIIVGTGLAYQYGIIERITISDCGTPKKEQILGFTPNSVRTTWVYTVGHIKGIIETNQTSLDMLENLSAEEKKKKVLEIDKLKVSIKNWNEILRYHKEETLPHRLLCTKSYADEVDDADILNEINKFTAAFCKDYSDAEIIWDDKAIEAYNNAINAIRKLLEPGTSTASKLALWSFDPERFSDEAGYADPEFENMFGKAAENFTFSGQTETTRTMNLARSQEHDISLGGSLGGAATITTKLENKVTVIIGGGLGAFFGKIEEFADVSADFSNTLSFNATIKDNTVTSFEESTEISYTLSDDDAGDQHSVTVVNGVSPRHTPYFYRFAGRSSCPPETGDIIRDDPKISIFDPVSGAAKKAIQLYNQNPDEPVTLTIYVANNSPFGEDREVSVFLNNASNEEGAFLKVAGNSLGTVDVGYIPPGVTQPFTLTIERNVAYRYDNLQIGVVATCGGPNQNKDYIDVSIQFESPCTPVTIVAPNNNWLVNGVNATLAIGLRDYQPDNAIFDQLELQYRRVDTGDDWDCVNTNELSLDLGEYAESFPTFDLQEELTPGKAFLAAFNDVFVGTPTFNLTWAIPEDVQKYPDGDYEIRVVAICQGGSTNLSNVVSGRINRSDLDLEMAAEPSDGLWLRGEDINATFNQSLNCGVLTDPEKFNITVLDSTTNLPITDFRAICDNDKLSFDFGATDNAFNDLEVMKLYDGHLLKITIDQATAISGTQLTEPIVWIFKVVTQELFWATDTIDIELYADQIRTISVDLIKTVAPQAEVLGATLNAIGDEPWLTLEIPNGNSLDFGAGITNRTVNFIIDGSPGQGEVMETIEVAGLGQGNTPTLVIKAKIFNRPPTWTVPDEVKGMNTMDMIANWKFIGKDLSIDTMDIISVWIDGELRGVARVEFSGKEATYASYLAAIYGNDDTDEGKPLEFRIWDAEPGIEYLATTSINNGNTLGPVTFKEDKSIGTTESPQELLVDKEQGAIRVIPLKEGWTGFSINFENADNSLTNLLGSLTKLTTGDKIYSADGAQGQLAEYTEGIGWVSSEDVTNLTTLSPMKGYQIYLQSGRDTLYVTGAEVDATGIEIDLVPGWNWLGFPLQTASTPADAFKVCPLLADGSRLKTVNRINPNGGELLLDYNGTDWSPANSTLKPYDFVKMYVANANTPVTLKYNDLACSSGLIEPLVASSRNSSTANPLDQATWIMDGTTWENQIPLIASVSLNGSITQNVNDQLAVFGKDAAGNDELRGVGNIEYIAATDKYVVVISMGVVESGETLDLYYFSAADNKVFEMSETLTTDLGISSASIGYGQFATPYPLGIDLFDAVITMNDILCLTDKTGSISVTTSGAFSPIYAWSHDGNVSSSVVSGLSKGTYTVIITDVRGVPVEKTIEIGANLQPIPVPTVTGAENAICQGEEVTLTAASEVFNAAFRWYNEAGTLLGSDNSLTLANRQTAETIKVITVGNGVCFSDFAEIEVTVKEIEIIIPEPAFTLNNILPEVDNQEVNFTPTTQNASYTYLWNFGDGNESTDMLAGHIYTDVGTFPVTLTITPAEGCAFISEQFMVTTQATACSDITELNAAIPDGIYKYADQINSTGIVDENQMVEFRAGTAITLGVGFHAKANSDFLARIQPCIDEVTLQEPLSERVQKTDVATLKKVTTDLTIMPNPTTGNARIKFSLTEGSMVELTVYSPQGQLINQLIRPQFYDKGEYEFNYLPANLSFGIYHVVLKRDSEVMTKKLIIIH